MYINAGKVYENAVRMVNGIPRGRAETTPGELGALSAIMFAALSLETFINEVRFLARVTGEAEPHNGPLRALADALEDLGRAPISTKYVAAKFMISGRPFDRNADPYKSFIDLIRLRNQIVHQDSFKEIKSDKHGNITVAKRNLEPFRSFGLLGQIPHADILGIDPDRVHTNWLDDVSTRAMGVWACSAASAMVNGFLDSVPQGLFRTKLESAYREKFSATPLRARP